LNKNKPPFRLVLGSKAAAGIAWHCKHYVERGQMKQYKNGKEMADDMGIPISNLEATFKEYNSAAKGEIKDPYGKTRFVNADYSTADNFHVITITPIVHYCMGGIKINPDS